MEVHWTQISAGFLQPWFLICLNVRITMGVLRVPTPSASRQVGGIGTGFTLLLKQPIDGQIYMKQWLAWHWTSGKRGVWSLWVGKQIRQALIAPAYCLSIYSLQCRERKPNQSPQRSPWVEEKELRVQELKDRVLKRRKLHRLEDFKRSDGPLKHSAEYVSMHINKLPWAREGIKHKDQR